MKSTCLIPTMAALILGANGLWAQPMPTGPEVQVNTVTSQFQDYPDVATLEDGSFVVVWMDVQDPESTTGVNDIKGRRFDSAGALLAGEFQVNELTTGYQLRPRITGTTDGGFVVVWPTERTGGIVSVESRRFTSTATPVGGDLQIASGTSLYPYLDVGPLDSGGFVVVWEEYQPTGDASLSGIVGQRFASDGMTLSGPFLVNATTADYQVDPSVDGSGDGRFVVAWQQDTDYDLGGDSLIQGRRFDSAGGPVAGDFAIATFTTTSNTNPEVAMAPNGDFVVGWSQYDLLMGTGENAVARIFASDGTPQGPEFVVHDDPDGGQYFNDISIGAQGQFVVTWTDYGIPLRAADPPGVEGRFFESSGIPLGGDFAANTYQTSRQSDARVTTADDGDVMVVWSSEGSLGDDNLQSSVQARYYRGSALIGNLVWNDLDRDGIQDGGEPGIDGVTVNLRAAVGDALLDTTVTAGGGLYGFSAAPDDFVVEFILPAGFVFTGQNVGMDDTVDSDADPSTGRTGTINGAIGDDESQDAGLQQLADVSVTKTGAPDPVVPGQNLVYTLTVANGGPGPAEGIVLSDVLPAEVSWVSDTCGVGAPVGGTWTWSVGALVASTDTTCSLTVLVDANVTAGFTNTATVSADSPDDNAVNDTSSWLSATSVADTRGTVEILWPGGITTLDVGGTVPLRITVENLGPDSADGVMASISLPGGLAYVSDTCAVGPDMAGTWTWTIGVLAPSASTTCDLVVEGTAPGFQTAVTTIGSSPFDPNLSNNVIETTIEVRGTNDPPVIEVPTLGPRLSAVLAILLGLAGLTRLGRRRFSS